MTAVVVLAKLPREGAVKTRLAPPLSLAEAAEFASACLADTLDLVDELPWSLRALALDVPSEAWLRPGWTQLRQRAGGLDQRIEHALCETQRLAAADPTLLIGMDTPHLRPRDLLAVSAALESQGAALGPASDGGYWAIGLQACSPGLVAGVPMSSGLTYFSQWQRLVGAGLSVAIGAVYRDIDTYDDARAAAQRAPRARFAQALRSPAS